MKGIIRTSMMAVIAILISSSLTAQDKTRISREELALKQAEHICETLAFDKPTADRFKGTYCSYQKELWALGPSIGKQSGENTDGEEIEQRFERSQKILDLRRKYYNIYSSFLTPKQISRVYEIERNMMHRLAAQNGRKAKAGARRQR